MDDKKIRRSKRSIPVYGDNREIIGYSTYLLCIDCGTVMGCEFTYRPTVWYYETCPVCNKKEGVRNEQTEII